MVREMKYLNPPPAAGLIAPSLSSTTTAGDDPKKCTRDPAFFLATHNYDVNPREGCVELGLDAQAQIHKLPP
ncbi:MAG: hypothetical protein ACE14P_07100 [Methanotrichaceae archaeon]